MGAMADLLIVDDDEDGREALRHLLERAGHHVQCASNGKSALATILARTPDLLILDLFMPGMDGPGLLEILRSYMGLRTLPVVVLTGAPHSSLIERMRHFNVNTVLVKATATFEDVLRAISEELSRLPK